MNSRFIPPTLIGNYQASKPILHHGSTRLFPFSPVKATYVHPRSDPQFKLKSGLSIEKKLGTFPPFFPSFSPPPTTRSTPTSVFISPPLLLAEVFLLPPPLLRQTSGGLHFPPPTAVWDMGEGEYGRTRDRNPTLVRLAGFWPAGWHSPIKIYIPGGRYLSLQFLFPRGENCVHALCAVGTIQTATLKKVSRRRGKKETSILDPDSHKLNCSANNLSSLLFGQN